MNQTVDMLVKVAYAEGVKQALLEHGVDENTAHDESIAFTEEKFAGVKDVAKKVTEAVGGAARRAGGAVSGAARRAGGAASGAARGAKETIFGGKPGRSGYRSPGAAGTAADAASRAAHKAKGQARVMRNKARDTLTTPGAKRNIAVGAGTLAGMGAGVGGKTLYDKIKED